MNRKAITSGSKFEALAGYSRAVADGDWVFVSGTTGADKSGKFSPDVAAQTRQSLATIAWALDEAGSSLGDIVRLRVYLADRADVMAVSAILRETFSDPRPTNTTIICGFPAEEIKVELEVTARKRASGRKGPMMSETDGAGLPVDSQVTFFYYKDLAAPERFYGETLGFPKTFDKGWVKFFRLTPCSYVGLVDEARGHHKALDQKSVMLSMETADLEAWYERAKRHGASFQTHPDFAAAAQKMITGFMLSDPGGYTVEFFRFNRKD